MKTYKVYLNIYDFMSCNGCLETIGVGAFHTGVEVGYLSPHAATPNTATASAPATQKTQASWKWNPKPQTISSTANCT